jgi:hypothetical protein
LVKGNTSIRVRQCSVLRTGHTGEGKIKSVHSLAGILHTHLNSLLSELPTGRLGRLASLLSRAGFCSGSHGTLRDIQAGVTTSRRINPVAL